MAWGALSKRVLVIIKLSGTHFDQINGSERAYAKRESNRTSQTMATNPPKGDGHRNGAVRDRSQFQTPSGLWAKRDGETGRIMDVKTSTPTPHKGVRKEK